MSLLIIKASAGSGKTFRLVREYLKLALQLDKKHFTPNYFNRILAITFTNEATAEMKERVLEELKKLSEAPETSDHYSYFVEDKTNNITKETIQRRATECLEKILTEYDSFSISTIDKFFQKIMRSIIHETNVSGNFDIELDTKKMYEKAIDKRIGAIDVKDPMYEWVERLRKQKIIDGKSFQFAKDLTAIPNVLNSTVNAKKFTNEQMKKLVELYKLIEFETSNFERDINTNAKEIKEDLSDFGDSRSKNFCNPFEKEGKELIENIQDSASLRKIKSDDKETFRLFLKKDNYNKTTAEEKQKINKIGENFVDLRTKIEKNAEFYHSLLHLKKHFISFAVFNYLQDAIHNYAAENQIITLQQSYETINTFVNESDAPFVYEKIGQKFKHIFVDEFQDTASTQYKNLYPLFIESLSTANKNLVVGDIKQSIYRWRQGDWRLLHSVVKQDFKNQIEEINLKNNYRSSPVIVNFNNNFYKFASNQIVDLLTNNINTNNFNVKDFSDLNAIKEVYSQEDQNASKEHDGLVQLEFHEKANNNNTESFALKRMMEIINDALGSGYRKKDILILFRNNKEGKTIADHLLSHSNNSDDYRFTSKQSLLISNSDSVELIISVMNFLLEKNKWIALGEIVYYTNNLGLQVNWKLDTIKGTSKESNYNMEKHLMMVFPQLQELKLRSSSMTLLEITNNIISTFGLDAKSLQHEHSYLQKFQDVVLTFEQKESLSIGEFLEDWEEKKQKTSLDLPSNIDAIRLLSMHGSKGLQAPVVIIPFGNINYKGKWENIIWAELPEHNVNPKLNEYRELGPFPMNLEKSIQKTYFKKAYFEELILQFLDTLNLYYVATTRSENRLYIFIEENLENLENENEELNLKTGKQLYDFCKIQELFSCEKKEGYVVIKYGNAIKNEKTAKPVLHKNFQLEKLFVTAKNISIKSDWLPEKLISATDKEIKLSPIERGIITHKLLENVVTHSNLSEVVNSAALEGLISSKDVQLWEQQLKEIIHHPSVTPYFSDDIIAINERGIISPGMKLQRPDRIVLKGEELYIIDYKTGNKQTIYKDQIQSYANLLFAMGYKKIKGFILYTDLIEIDEIALNL